ncbi:4-hydroxyacetophenone monooxygenase [Cupriavidus sp. USMAA2-4]|uniref:4-hydroxyacetophenone monooxygenase n=1 Tax=Cupriavidus malaysiensis TaxID=367825 RepID=A0ABN4TJI1_9BURK|nr:MULTISPECIES: NAD(P)/FAD-dependent oxidoreductase [Cupriavidus]AOY92248.1 4-hydroxyacetophenone monooxygenase [Cupriavidus sp. USMAA2-4]AOZ04606.1 4-hydroxyacetophenone monooxygenase [Cupriavidus malaysiensis]
MNAPRVDFPIDSVPAAAGSEHIDIAIVGSGFAGLAMAIRLKQSGQHDFAILEKADAVGGTWRDNHYPGCACDVQSHLYSFSFAPNPGWSRMFSTQPEIRAYLEHCADRFGLRPHLRLSHELRRAAWDEAGACWRLEMADGRRLSARVLVSGMGGLSRPAYPRIPGLDSFAGEAFHSQHWNHGYDFRGKRVAVIGTGASAIQFVPQVAPRAGHLDLYQRTPPWIMPKPDRRVTAAERWLFRHLPFTQKLVRTGIYWALESRVLGFVVHPGLMKLVERVARRHIQRQVPDAALRARLTPDYTIGCKRVLISNDYYPALTRANVDVVSTGIARVEPDAIVLADGTRRETDCIIFGTGFHATDPIPRGVILGRDGVDILDAWRDGAQAYLGTTVAGFPNFFMVVGPNTGLGHSSMVFMIESQVAYILDALQRMRAGHVHAVDVRAEVQRDFNDGLQARLGHAVWSAGGCASWYLDPRTGRNTTLWPGFTWQFRRATATFRLADYHTLPQRRSAVRPGEERHAGAAQVQGA